MTTRTNEQTPASIPLGKDFHRLFSGSASIIDLAAEHAAERARLIAIEDDYMRRRRQHAELDNPFAGGYCC